ncbi:hypothetical protein MKW94_023094 [Papaver nudicaule]|uniref:AP2/ERF domain-containing protein n=1 Tax=Papaver nudicaule TaxID=74823 RepID=A0AA41SI66_PAPNU|nr:hypothetical protein [Papaver nudicaule]
MSSRNWLGFSQSSIEDGFEDGVAGAGPGAGGGDQSGSNGGENGSFPSHNQHDNISVISLLSDSSLCIVDDPFVGHFSTPSGWTYEKNTMSASTKTEYYETAGPKLEDFSGSYSNSNDQINGVYNYHQNQQQQSNNENGGNIKINISPPTSTFMGTTSTESHQQEREIDDSLTTQYLNYNFQQQYNLNSYPNTTYHQVPIENATSISGFKIWLRQTGTQFPNDNKSLILADPINTHNPKQNSSLFQSMSTVSTQASTPSSNALCVQQQQSTSCRKRDREPVLRKSLDTFCQRTSQYRGVSRHKWTGRYVAHLWDNSCRKEGQTRIGRQGRYNKEIKAAKAYDLAALKYWGPTAHINFPFNMYEKELEEMKNMNRQEYVTHLRRKSSGFSRGASMYRGVYRNTQSGRWQARIGRAAGNKDLYLGTFSTQEEAAEAYDTAAIKLRGPSALTNFEISKYDVKRICASLTLIGGHLVKRPSPQNSSASVAGFIYESVVVPTLAITNGDQYDHTTGGGDYSSQFTMNSATKEEDVCTNDSQVKLDFNSTGNCRNRTAIL